MTKSNHNEIQKLEHDDVFDVKKVSSFVDNGDGTLVRQISISEGSTWLQQLGIDKDDLSYYYFGFKKIDTNLWRIKRLDRTTLAVDWASGDSNPDTAWANRASLTYGNL